jgi:hypothetical protein
MNRNAGKVIAAKVKMDVPAVRVSASAELFVKLSRDDMKLTDDELVNVAEYLVAVAYKKVVVSAKSERVSEITTK